MPDPRLDPSRHPFEPSPEWQGTDGTPARFTCRWCGWPPGTHVKKPTE